MFQLLFFSFLVILLISVVTPNLFPLFKSSLFKINLLFLNGFYFISKQLKCWNQIVSRSIFMFFFVAFVVDN